MNARKSKRSSPKPPPGYRAGAGSGEAAPAGLAGSASRPAGHAGSGAWSREAVESIVVAILLALLFRGFEAEAFIIPTGSMAPTLQGRHKDVRCPQCDYAYRAGAARESSGDHPDAVVATTCPMCSFELSIDPRNPYYSSFSGDRILVNKFIYQLSEPRRWDVIVFKFPGNAKQNYIKRLVGLPEEELRIRHGDVFARPLDSDQPFQILRKPAKKIRHMLHLVHDTRYVPEQLLQAGWPARWQATGSQGSAWQASADQRRYTLQAGDERVEWLRYRHLAPSPRDWRQEIQHGRLPGDVNARAGSLITDFYAYNAYRLQMQGAQPSGWHWVGDLALETRVEVESPGGEIWLQLVEGGHRIECRLDVATGVAEMTIDQGQRSWAAVEGRPAPQRLTTQTPLRGTGKYRLMLANVDDQAWLWVNGRLMAWQDADGQPHPGYFELPPDIQPQWSSDDPGDLLPLAVGGKNVRLVAEQLRVYRDIYYVATSSSQFTSITDYPDFSSSGRLPPMALRTIFSQPHRWSQTDIFRSRQEVHFRLQADQFFPLGDNSPASKDARLWGGPGQESLYYPEGVDVPPYVARELLIGKAFLVYWPHGWPLGPVPIPILPNLDRMGRIQ